MSRPPAQGGEQQRLLQAGALMRLHLMFFLPWVFRVLHPADKQLTMSWYLRAMCQAFHKVARGQVRRLVINVPPRHLKSITSVAFAAWMLGKNPALKIMLVTYGEKLNQDHLEKLTKVMTHPFYRRLFPATRIAARGKRQHLITTTQGGGCRSVTVGGATTGFGADIILIDDAMKADDITSQARRDELERFYKGTVLTRLDDKQRGIIISVQQRLGEDDLPGQLIEQGAEHLNLPAYNDEERVYDIGLGRIYRRPLRELLRPKDETWDVLENLRREMGPHGFATQILQQPCALEGNIIRTDKFARFPLDDWPRVAFNKIVQSWDVATSVNTRADWSVCLTFGYDEGEWFLVDVLRERMEYPQLLDRVVAQRKLWKADVLLIEDAGPGQHLIQDLRHRFDLRPLGMRPVADKITRMVGQLGMIEDEVVIIPGEAPWLPPFLGELKSFPSGRHDDQVDALSQFLEWAKFNDKWARTQYDPVTGRRMFLERR